MRKAVPEPNAELLSVDDAERDVASLSAALEQRRAERRAYEILSRPHIREMLSTVLSTGACRSEDEAIERALNTMVTALAP